MEENKKNTRGLIVLVIILFICVIGLGGYIVYDKLLNKSSQSIDNSKSTKTPEINEKNNFDKIVSYDITLNNKPHKIYYKYKIEKTDNSDYENINQAKENGDYIYNELHVEIYLDNQKLNNIIIYYDTENNIENVKNTKEILDLSNIKVLKGTDNKDYLVFVIEEDNINIDGRKVLFITTEAGSVIYNYEPEFNSSISVTNSNSKFYNINEQYIIESNRIYVAEIVENNESETSNIQENIITVQDDKINIEKGNIYESIISGAR